MARFSWPWSRREQFSTSIGTIDTSFAAWLSGSSDADGPTESVTPYTVLGLSAVMRAVWVISTTIAGLPLRAYERGEKGARSRIISVFDDPFPGVDGMTPFAWVETVLIHLLLWRKAFLWHEQRDERTGHVSVFRPLLPDAIEKVERVNGKYRFTYKELLDDGSTQERVVGSEMITYIPGPSLDGATGHPLLTAAKAIFAGALSGDKAAARTLRMGIRLAGLIVPEEGEEVDETEGKAILEALRQRVVGRENAGDVALINRRMKLHPWTSNNIESQWHETRQMILGEIERLFGMVPHLDANVEKQTSWGSGVAEQTLNLQRFTLRGWSDRLEQSLTRRLPNGSLVPIPGTTFLEFDYRGILQGTPAQEIELLLKQIDSGVLTVDEYRQIQNLPPLTRAQKAAMAGPQPMPAQPQENPV